MSKQFQKINEFLKKAKRISIASHENPDPDAVGSALALHLFFKKLNLDSFCYLPTPPPKSLYFLSGFFEIKNEIAPDFLNSDAVFCLDYGDFRRLKLPDSISEKNLITIDHHQGDQRGEILVVEPNSSSTAEIIYSFFENFGIKIDQKIASCLLAGIAYDTGLFSHACTSPETMKVVSSLLLKGAPFTKIVRSVSQFGFPDFFKPSQMKILGRALSRVKFDPRTNLVYSFLSHVDLKECQIFPNEVGEISTIISTVFPARLSLFLVEYEKGKIKGSLRSEPFGRGRVDQIAQALGGGGHHFAAGFKQEGKIEEVLKKVMNLIR